MRILCSFIIIIFSILTTIAFIFNKTTDKKIKILELVGQILVLAFVPFYLFNNYLVGNVFLISGVFLIMLACILNGKCMYGKINISHHVIRGLFFAINIFLIIK